jgi:hypothetical protein
MGSREGRQVIFSHFLFRRLTTIDPQPSHSLLQELLITSEAALLSTYQFLHNRPIPLPQMLSPRLALNSIALARQ